MKKVIRYTGSWCQPCKIYAPKFEKVASETPGVEFETIDVDSGDPRLLEHGIRNVPTTVVIENNQVRKQTGNMSVDQLKAFIG